MFPLARRSFANFWIHRYCAHHAYSFKNSFYRTVCRNLVIKIVPEEIHVVSHLVHHYKSDTPGDPYNAGGGWLYCFLADEIHQGIRKDLIEKEYNRMSRMLKDTGVKINSYDQYIKWGSLCHPLYTFGHYLLNWAFWFTVFYFLGGLPLLMAILGGCGLWVFGRRTFAYRAHGAGENRRRDGVDFDQDVSAVNRMWTGIVAGEWHNNHHLYPGSARCGFLPYQIDLPWLFIRVLYRIGWISEYQDQSAHFHDKHWRPYQARLLLNQYTR